MFWAKLHVKYLLNSRSQTSLVGPTGLGFTVGSVIHLSHFCIKYSPNFKGEFSNWSGTYGSGHLSVFLLLVA